jgi:hypothetical protein
MPRTRRPLEPPLYTFRVRILGGFYAPEEAHAVWREIAVAANQTLADLREAIPLAFDFADAHLWSFFLSGQPWDRESEYALHSAPDRSYCKGILLVQGKRLLITGDILLPSAPSCQ